MYAHIPKVPANLEGQALFPRVHPMPYLMPREVWYPWVATMSGWGGKSPRVTLLELERDWVI